MTRTKPIGAGFSDHKGNCALCVKEKPNNPGIIEHAKNGHRCPKTDCPASTYPHSHHIGERLREIFPFEEKIKNLNIGSTAKQLLLMASNLTPAIGVAEILKPLNVSSFITSPAAISAMHLTNRGNKQLHKLLFISLSSIGVIGLQKFMNLPRILIRPLMALAVFFIEKNGSGQKSKPDHIHTPECSHEHVHEKQNQKLDAKHLQNGTEGQDLLKLLKLQGQINTVPWAVSFFTNKLKEINNKTFNPLIRFFGHVGVSVFQVAALSLGFVGLGHLIDKSLLKFNVITDRESLAMRAEGAVCACCGAPVCVAEVASEVGSMSVAA